MKVFYSSVVILCCIFSQAFFSMSASADCVITTTLRLGSKGIEVQCLQIKLGIAADGNFGPMTKASVVAFQFNKGLSSDGVVGALSRAVFNGFIVDSGLHPAGCTSISGYSITTGAKCDRVAVSQASNSIITNENKSILTHTDNAQQNPVSTNTTGVATVSANLVNMDKFINTVVEVNKKNGSSAEQLQTIADTLKKSILASDIDYNAQFQKVLQKDFSTSTQNQATVSYLDKFLNKVGTFLGVTPSVAEAATGTAFGGQLFYSYFCSNGQYMIGLTPLPPSYAVLLSYTPGTQSFSSYNIPQTTWLLGTYSGTGLCVLSYYPYISMNTEGMISATVGSSPK